VLVNLYSGTFEQFAALLPDTFQRSLRVTPHVTHKYSIDPLNKGLEAHSTTFSLPVGKQEYNVYKHLHTSDETVLP
jgi:hypothetical protein